MIEFRESALAEPGGSDGDLLPQQRDDTLTRVLQAIDDEFDAWLIERHRAGERGDDIAQQRAHTVWHTLARLRDIARYKDIEHPYTSMSVQTFRDPDTGEITHRALRMYGRPVGSYTTERGLAAAIDKHRTQPDAWGAMPVRIGHRKEQA